MTSTIRQSVLDLIGEGLTDTEIAARLGVTRNSVIGHRHRAGVACNVSDSPFSRRKHNDGRKFPNWKGGIGARTANPLSPSNSCKWIDGDPQKSGWSYCGAPVSHVGSAWCAAHRKRVYAGSASPLIERTPEEQAALNIRMAKMRAARAA